jgi:hypothetical protein
MYRPGSSRCRYVAWTDAVAQPMRSRRLLAPPRLRSGAHLATHAPRLCIATCLLRHHKPSECMRRLKPISLRHQRRHLARPAHAKHDSPAVEGGETGSVAGCCCKSIPKLQTFCTLVIIVGIAIFGLKSGQAFAAVRSLLAELKVVGPFQATTKAATAGLLGVGMAVLAIILALSLIATCATMNGRARRYRMRHGREGGGVFAFLGASGGNKSRE